jgi:hypothetical protein
MRFRRIALCVLFLGGAIVGRAGVAFAQGSMPGMQMPGTKMPGMTMAPAGPLGIDPSRDGSGTSWQPDDTPMSGPMRSAGAWTFMLHGAAFLEELRAGGSRGARQFGSVNWVMGMAERSTSSSALTFRTMLSVEPLTVGRCGYPDLVQTGEACRGAALHDVQHPHDLFMEVAVDYRRALGSGVAFELYGGPAGEPALGPVAFPHRSSAAMNLLAPIGHHWLDATHVSFGVATAGLYGRKWKAETSAFNGREPDDMRYGFDLAALDSYSGRLSWLPTSQLTFQVSAGHLTDEEAHAGSPGATSSDVMRITASGTYHRLMGDRLWATTVAWGRNSEDDLATSAWLAETSFESSARDAWYGRFEVVGKTATELSLASSPPRAVLDVAKAQVGYTRWVWRGWGARVGLGGYAAVSRVPAAASIAYGSRVPGEVAVYLTVRPK